MATPQERCIWGIKTTEVITNIVVSIFVSFQLLVLSKEAPFESPLWPVYVLQLMTFLICLVQLTLLLFLKHNTHKQRCHCEIIECSFAMTLSISSMLMLSFYTSHNFLALYVEYAAWLFLKLFNALLVYRLSIPRKIQCLRKIFSNFKLSNKDFKEFSDQSCTICIEQLSNNQSIIALPCSQSVKHCFHEACLKEWLNSSDVCPNCRCSDWPLPRKKSSRKLLQKFISTQRESTRVLRYAHSSDRLTGCDSN